MKPVEYGSLEEGTLRRREWQVRRLSGRRQHGEYTEREQWEKRRMGRVKCSLVPNEDGGVEGVHSIC